MNKTAKNFLQSEKWRKMNAKIGHKTLTETFTHQGQKYPVLAIIKDARRGRYLEVPGGPLIDWQNKALVAKVFARLKEIAKSERCAFIRIRPQLLDTPENRKILKNQGLKPAPMHLHAEHTVLIDLTEPEDALLANMRRQTRYEVRRSAKQNLKVEKGNSKKLFEEFHQVQTETAARQNFIPPSLDDLLAEREAFGQDAVIYVAKTPEYAPIAYGLILKDGDEADYFEAASTDLNRKLPGAYALQWQVIRDLKKEGYRRYNLWGIAPPGAKNHRYSGVTTFKTGFGGENITFLPAHDLVISPPRYLLNYLVETIRKKKRHL